MMRNPTNLKDLYLDHVASRQKLWEKILSELRYDGIVLSSGEPFTYFADDHDAPFVPNPYFAYWCIDENAFHLLQIRVGKRPRLILFRPNDFWHEQEPLKGEGFFDPFEILEVSEQNLRWQQLGDLKNHAFIGNELAPAKEKGLDCNPPLLISSLDWQRCLKTPYEIECLSLANQKGSRAHQKARQLFTEGASELQIHQGYLQSISVLERQLPYENIIALNEKSATLHYRNKREVPKTGNLLLIDAGAKCNAYGSDITRTYLKKQFTNHVFGELLQGMEKGQQYLCSLVKEGVEFVTLHKQCWLMVTKLLYNLGFLVQGDEEWAMKNHIPGIFLPHGLGHMLGIQVHDVGGRQINAQGDPAPSSPEFPKLRMLRALREKEVITIEPGIYFIPMLLNPYREHAFSGYFDWNLIDTCLPFGGIRIEDDVVVEKNGMRNLTREQLSVPLFT